MILIVLFLFSSCLACHPQSRWLCDDPCSNWACDDPVCDVLCEPICNVSCICFNPQTNSTYPKHCEQRCPEDQCESDACPSCETICTECRKNYHALCEETSCQWKCRADPDCPKPTCEPILDNITCQEPECHLQSERPACEYSSAVLLGIAIKWSLLWDRLLGAFPIHQTF